MSFNPASAMRALIIVAGVAVVWLAFFNLNASLFAQLSYTERATWIFLPAALRVLAILLFGGRGAIGLMLGAYLTLPHERAGDLPHEVLLSISSGLAPLLAVVTCQRIFAIKCDLAGLRGSHIVALSLVTAAANSLLLNILMLLAGRHHGDVTLAVTIFVGDTIGAAILLFAIAVSVTAISRLVRSQH